MRKDDKSNGKLLNENADRPIDILTHTMYAAVKDNTEKLLCIVDTKTKIESKLQTLMKIYEEYEGFAYLADNTNINTLSINSLSIIDNKLYGLTSDQKLVIISDLHKTTANYSVTSPDLTESYNQIFKLKNHDDNHDDNSFKIGLLKKSTDGTDGKIAYCDYDGSNIT